MGGLVNCVAGYDPNRTSECVDETMDVLAGYRGLAAIEQDLQLPKPCTTKLHAIEAQVSLQQAACKRRF